MQLYLFMSFPAALVGLVIVCIAAARHRSVIRRRSLASARADARIVEELVRLNRLSTRSTPHYIYEFPVDGIPRRAEFAGLRRFRVGDVVTVFYDPNHPETIYIPEAQSWLVTIALYFIGGAWLFEGIMLFIYWMLGIQ